MFGNLQVARLEEIFYRARAAAPARLSKINLLATSRKDYRPYSPGRAALPASCGGASSIGEL